MGNDTSKPPTNYNPKEVHEGEYLQTYRGGTGEKVNMGQGIKPLSLGVKIIQSIDDHKDYLGQSYGPNEYYVVQPNGRRVYLTKGGEYKKNADTLIVAGAHFGEGPAIMIGGDVSAPTYTVFSSTSTAPGSAYTPMTVNNPNDLRDAIWYGHKNEPKGQYASSYGSAAVNPFKDRPRNTFSTLAEIGRGVVKGIDALAIPVLEFGLDEVTDGLGSTLMQVTGLEDVLQQGLDKLTEMHGLEFKTGSSSTAPFFTDIVRDPRMNDQYHTLIVESRKKTTNTAFSTNRYQKELAKLVNTPHRNNAEKMLAMRKIENMNLRFDGQQQMDMLSKTVKLLKKMVPDPPGFSWDLTEKGLANATDPQMQIRFAERTTENLLKRVVPLMKKQAQSAQQTPTSAAKATEKPDKTPEDPGTKVTSGLINGGKSQDAHPTEIKG